MPYQSLSSDHYLEVRYEPMGTFLNIRGAVADFVKEKGTFRHWQIGTNRVDFWNSKDADEDTEKAFVSFRNCGYQGHNPPTENFFSDRAAKFVAMLDDVPGFEYPPISRLGVRAYFYHSVENLGFDELRDRYINKFLSNRLTEAFDGEINDVGLDLDCRSGSVFFNTRTGPMKKEQFIESFSPAAAKDPISAAGLYFDVDVFKRDLKKIQRTALIREIKALHEICWQKYRRLTTFLEI